MNLNQTVKPKSEPVTRDDVKSYTKIEVTDDDMLVDSLIESARVYCEEFTNRAFVTQTFELRLEGSFPGEIVIPKPPLQSVTSIQYVDTDGVTQTLAATEYDVDIYSYEGRIREAYSKSWPSTRDQMNSIIVTFVCGYGDPKDVPNNIKQAIYLLVSHWYENRELLVMDSLTEAPKSVDSLLWISRVKKF